MPRARHTGLTTTATTDYNRYLAEISTEKAQRDAIKAAEDSYNKAQALADSNITDVPYPHPLRLGLALNRAVWHVAARPLPHGRLKQPFTTVAAPQVLYYEIINDTNKAIQICKTAVDEGVEDISKLIDQQYKVDTHTHTHTLAAHAPSAVGNRIHNLVPILLLLLLAMRGHPHRMRR